MKNDQVENSSVAAKKYHYNDFELYADSYDKWFQEHSPIFESESRLLEAMDISGRILDIGVGSGVFADAIGKRSSVPIIGIDPSWQMLGIATRRHVDAIQAVGEYLPFVDDVFDCVMMINTLSFLSEPHVVILECLRILKAECGTIVICEVPSESSWGRYYKEKRMKKKRFFRHSQFYSVSDLCNILTSLDMHIVETKGTLSYRPNEREIVENPQAGDESQGFVCVKATKGKQSD
jgi:ubiquinone/menaquinone biosynthesis C-methylase UbiE